MPALLTSMSSDPNRSAVRIYSAAKRLGVCHVGFMELRLAANPFDLVCGRGRDVLFVVNTALGRFLDIDDRHVGALAGEFDCYGPADP